MGGITGFAHHGDKKGGKIMSAEKISQLKDRLKVLKRMLKQHLEKSSEITMKMSEQIGKIEAEIEEIEKAKV